MKSFRLTGLFVASVASIFAQDLPGSAGAYAPPPPTAGLTLAPLNAEQLDQLLGPIALYPDALIALILPAATVPADIVLAARYLRQQGSDLSQVENRAWDESVKSLIHYPDVVKWMDENLLWTKQLGEAFAEQPAEVMRSLQRLRGRAQASGALLNNPQQQVLVEQQTIRIVPAQPDVIYVPYYDPAIVYVDRPLYYSYGRPALTFGVGCRTGSWLAHDFDWGRSTIWIGDRHRHWDHRHDWHRPVVVAPIAPRSGYAGHRAPRAWEPPARTPRSSYTGNRPPHSDVSRTTPTRGVSPASSSHGLVGPVAPISNADLERRPHRTAPPLQRVGEPNPGQASSAAPAPTVAPATRSRNAVGSRDPDARPRFHQAPAATSSLPSAPPLQRSGPPPQSYPTVVAPAWERSQSARAPTPVAAPPLQAQGGSTYHAAQPGPTVAPAPPAAASTPPAPTAERVERPIRDRRLID